MNGIKCKNVPPWRRSWLLLLQIILTSTYQSKPWPSLTHRPFSSDSEIVWRFVDRSWILQPRTGAITEQSAALVSLPISHSEPWQYPGGASAPLAQYPSTAFALLHALAALRPAHNSAMYFIHTKNFPFTPRIREVRIVGLMCFYVSRLAFIPNISMDKTVERLILYSNLQTAWSRLKVFLVYCVVVSLSF